MKNYILNIYSNYLLEEEINKIVSKEDNIINLNYDDLKIDDVILECSYYSLIDTSKCVIVKNFKLNEEARKLINYLENPNKDVKLVLICNNYDKRNKIYKDIKDKINIVEIKGLKPNEIINKINNYCKEKKIKIGYNDINYLLDKNQNDLDLVISEINKLSIISNNITIHTINTYGSFIPNDDSFELCDAIVEKKIKEITPLLNEFIEARKEVIPFIALLAMQYRYIYACKITNKSPDYLMKLFNVSSDYPFVKAKGRTSKYSNQELKEILLNLAKADLDLKSTDKDKYNILKTFISSVIV